MGDTAEQEMDSASGHLATSDNLQKEKVYNKLLPYANELDDDSHRMLISIKINLGLSVAMREIKPGCEIWTARLRKYIMLYGLKFSKEDHLKFIRLMYELIIIPHLEPHLFGKITRVLIALLKKRDLITPTDLVLQWKPLHNLCRTILFSSWVTLGMYGYSQSIEDDFIRLIDCARFYFSTSATEEMLNEWKPMLCPFDRTAMEYTIKVMSFFLPVALRPEFSHKGYKLWLEDMMSLWKLCNNISKWESYLMQLIAVLAENNIGYIDWEPHIPLMFCRFLRCFQLPLSYRNLKISHFRDWDVSAIALWIVSVLGGKSSAQEYLNNLMTVLESYFHPVNSGKWTNSLIRLLQELVVHFVERLHYERNRKLTWQTPVPNAKKLTEVDITTFVLSLKSVTLRAMFSSVRNEPKICLQYLAMLRPHLIIPDIIELFYTNIEATVRPHTFRAVLQCLTAVVRPMLESTYGYKEGPTYIIPLLTAVLPGIDPNDSGKSTDTFRFIGTVASMITIVDCSKASAFHENLCKEEIDTCLSTSNVIDFFLQYLDYCFTFISNSSLESTGLEQQKYEQGKLETVAQITLLACCKTVLQQTSPEVFQAGLSKLYSFTRANTLETNVAGRLMAGMCQAFAQANAKETLQVFIPYLSDNILTLTSSNDVLQQESLNSELLYNLQLISEIVGCHGSSLLPHIPVLMEVLNKSLSLSCREGFSKALRFLRVLLRSLSSIVPLEYCNITHSFDQHINEYLPIKDWGKPSNIDNLDLQFFIPGEKEIKCVKSIIDMHLPLQIELLKEIVDNPNAVITDKVEFSLEIIRNLLSCKLLFPIWNDAPMHLVDSCLSDNFCFSGIQLEHIAKDVSNAPICDINLKKALVDLLNKLQSKLLACKERSTKSLSVLTKIWGVLLNEHYVNKTTYTVLWRSYKTLKRFSGHKLYGNKNHFRSLIILRVLLQHEILFNRRTLCFTYVHRDILLNLLQLSVSPYSEIRYEARSVLSEALGTFPYSHTVLTVALFEYLKKDAVIDYDIFQGAVSVVLEPREYPIVVRHDWNVLHMLWPTIIRSQPEKPSILNLLKVVESVVRIQFGTISVVMKVSDNCVDAGVKLCKSASFEVLKEQIDQGKENLALKTQDNLDQYLSLLYLLVNIIEEESLHFRFRVVAMGCLMTLIHPEVMYPPEVAKCIFNSLISDSIELRTISVDAAIMVLKQQKPKHKKITINTSSLTKGIMIPERMFPGDRTDNQWVKYNPLHLLQSAEDWNQAHFLHREYHGYYCWPREITVYAASNEQSSLVNASSLNNRENEMFCFFSTTKNLEKLVEFLTLDSKKGGTFSDVRYLMFKGLFRNGDFALFTMFVSHLERLVCSSEENNQRCAAEIIAGVIRGAKHWSYEMIKNMWDLLRPIIENALQNVTEETITDWKVCFRFASDNRDPRWNHWLYRVLFEYPVQPDTSFLEAGRLSCIEGALSCHLWKLSNIFVLWLEQLRSCLSHQFQNVRQQVGEALSCIFEADLSFPQGELPNSPHISDFIAYTQPYLSSLYDINPAVIEKNQDKGKRTQNTDSINDIVAQNNNASKSISKMEISAVRLLKTLCTWMCTMISRSVFAMSPDLYKLVPLLCVMENDKTDSELMHLCSCTLGNIAQSIHMTSLIRPALEAVEMVSNHTSWQARVTCLEFLQVFVFYNMPMIRGCSEWSKRVKNIVLKLLDDKYLEVREKSAQVLCGLLHTDFIEEETVLLEIFKGKVAVKKGNKGVTMDPISLKLRHSAILGLCGFIDAHPYDVPSFIPDLFGILHQYLNDPSPISDTIRKTLRNFQRTHHDNWTQNKHKFSDEQLSVLEDIAVSPTYYA